MNAGPMLERCMRHQLLPNSALEPERARAFTVALASISQAFEDAGWDTQEGWPEPGDWYRANSYPGMPLVVNMLDKYEIERVAIPILMLKIEYWRTRS